MVRIHVQMIQAMPVKRYRITNVSILHYTSYDFVFQSWHHKNDFQTEHIFVLSGFFVLSIHHKYPSNLCYSKSPYFEPLRDVESDFKSVQFFFIHPVVCSRLYRTYHILSRLFQRILIL